MALDVWPLIILRWQISSWCLFHCILTDSPSDYLSFGEMIVSSISKAVLPLDGEKKKEEKTVYCMILVSCSNVF